jgi:hypothetical protein
MTRVLGYGHRLRVMEGIEAIKAAFVTERYDARNTAKRRI